VSLVRAYQIGVEVRRGGQRESLHTVMAAARGITVPGRYEVDASLLPHVWARSTAKPFQLLPLLLHPSDPPLFEDLRDVAVCVASHDGTPEHATRVDAILRRSGLGREWLLCGVHRPYYLQSLDPRASEHGDSFDALNNNCSGNHTAMLLWARACGTPMSSYLDANSVAQKVVHDVVRVASGFEPLIDIDNCGGPCYQMPLTALAQAYQVLAVPELAREWRLLPTSATALQPVADRVQRIEQISRAMASHPRWVSGSDTEATRLARAFQGDLVVKHGAEGVLCVASRRHGAAVALKVLDGNPRALFPALMPLLQEFGWWDPQEEPSLAALARPVLRGPAGHPVGELCAAAPSTRMTPTRDAPTPAV
jgi:L-asparaginase II